MRFLSSIILLCSVASPCFGATIAAGDHAHDLPSCSIGSSTFLCGDGGFDHVSDGGCETTCAVTQTPSCLPASCEVDSYVPSRCSCEEAGDR